MKKKNWTYHHHNHMRYGFWDTEWERRIFLLFQAIFVLLPTNKPENQNSEKLEKALHKCTKTEDHTVYGWWDIRHNRQSSFIILGHFLYFYPPNNPKKSKSLKNEKKPGDIIILHFVPKMSVIWCMVPEIRSATDILGHFGPLFAILPQ